MYSDSTSGRPIPDRLVDQSSVLLRQCVRVIATPTRRLAHVVVAEVGEVGVIELDVGRASVCQSLDLVAVDLRQVIEELRDQKSVRKLGRTASSDG